MSILDPKPTFIYWLRLNRLGPDGLAPLSLRVTLNGVRCELSPGISCPPAYWFAEHKQLLLPTARANRVAAFAAEEVERLNGELQQFKQAVAEICRRLQRPDPRGPLVDITGDDVRAAVRGTDSKRVRQERATARRLARPLLDMARAFVDTLQAVRKTDRLADSTLQNYESRLNTLRRYVETEHSKSLPASEIDIPWCRRYERWLLSEAGGFGGAAMRKQVNFLQLALDFAVHEGWLPAKLLHGYKFQSKVVAPPCLSLPAHEVTKLYTALPDLCDAERRAVTGWLFCAATGLSWVDYGWFCARPADYLCRDEVGQSWLRMVRQKMKRRKPQGFSVPLFDDAAQLLLDWRGCLPWSAGQNVNELLHRVEAELGLSQSLTTKLARATFSQLKRDAGYSDEAVAAMMGDSVSVMNRHYSRVSEQRISLEMARVTPGRIAPSAGRVVPLWNLLITTENEAA